MMRLEDIEYRKSVGAPKPLWDLAIEVVQLPGWDWLDGARTLATWRDLNTAPYRESGIVTHRREERIPPAIITTSGTRYQIHPEAIPDLTHPATGGALMDSELEDGWRVEWYGSRIEPAGLGYTDVKRLQEREAHLLHVIEEVQEALDDPHLDISGVDFWELDSLADAVKVVVNLAIERDGYKLMVGEVEAALRGEYSAEWEGYIAGEVAQLKRLHWEQ